MGIGNYTFSSIQEKVSNWLEIAKSEFKRDTMKLIWNKDHLTLEILNTNVFNSKEQLSD